MHFHGGDLLAGLAETVEVRSASFLAVLSNPPYIPLGEHDELPPEVRRHDPHLALFGGEDGLDVVRRLIPAAWDAGADVLAIEVGQGQPPAVVELLADAGFARTEVRDDLAGIGRVVVGWRDEAGGDDSRA
ncbi:MAG: hypothetical protein ITG02_05705 [Patulibacter sp.]|nr:hypothetical protein [Patulibacter sp.]